ncbi:MAG: ABC transporter substrate-binding protein [Pseudomonadota bacterium]|nr:ABC transporter substrate-binding protein [Pseudomonadota bacterium]
MWVLFAAHVSAAAAGDRVRLIVAGHDKVIYLPAKLAERLGYFAKEDLEVELVNERSGVDAQNQMLAGAVQGVVGFYDHCIELQAKGKAAQSIVQLTRTPGEVQLVSTRYPEIKSMADLRRKALGVTGLGSSTDFLTHYLMTRAGAKPSEFTTVPVGAGATFSAALQTDMIQAGMTTDPTATRLLRSNQARVLVDLRSVETTREALGGLYPGAAVYLPTDWVQAHKGVAQKLANAFVRSLRYISEHSAAEIAERMPPEFYNGDREMYVAILAQNKSMFTVDGQMFADGPATVLTVLSSHSRSFRGRTVDLSRTFTNEFVQRAAVELGK